MKLSTSLIAAAALVLVTVITGAVHGRLISRWGAQPDVESAAKRLDRVPDTIGDWQRIPTEGLDPEVAKILQCHGSISRVYENMRSGERVTIAVLLGPAGPIAVHTPEICYSSRDYRIAQDRTEWSIAGDEGSPSDTFWDLRLDASDDLKASPLRVIYGWTNHKHWNATKHPRFEFGGSPFLYKLQLAGPKPQGDADKDACSAFLTAFLPVLREHMIDR